MTLYALIADYFHQDSEEFVGVFSSLDKAVEAWEKSDHYRRCPRKIYPVNIDEPIKADHPVIG
jgi:hypothetical protein